MAEAKRTGKPILLSVGYAACHWCHVMAHESFEDDATAAVMNELFVNIKVDREERPDIDAIYMGALHALGEQGGWPLTMFLDSEARPVWGGTYFPKDFRYGRPAFVDVLKRVATVFREEPEKVAENAQALTEALRTPHAALGGADDRRPAAEGSHDTHGAGHRSGARRLAGRAEVSAVEFLLAALARRHPLRQRAGPRGSGADARQHLPGRHLRSPRRRLRALLGRRALAGAALREDALRQCAAASS